MRRLLFFDIDGTLAMPGHDPSLLTVRAVRAARENGHLVFLGTGRPVCLVPPAIREIGFDGGIYSAGGFVDVHGETLLNRPMSRELSTYILETLKAENLCFALECLDGCFHNVPPELDGFMENTRPYSEYAGESVYKISFFAPTHDAVVRLQKLLAGRTRLVVFPDLPDKFRFTMGEISDAAVHKGGALRRICEHFGADPSDAIAFGDSMNDAEMLKAAGLGIAMGNADPELKALADMICESCEAEGITKALKQLKLI